MSSKSQASYVARLSKAEQLHEYLVNFENYTSNNETLTKEALATLIANLHNIQNNYTQTQNDYLLATEQRRKSFDKEPNSIDKLLSPIGSYIKASLIKDARFYKEISSLVNKIRGNSRNTNISTDNETSISNSESSYGSRLQNFKDIMTLLQELGDSYQPANESIKLPALEIVYNQALANNILVSKTISIFKPNTRKRQEAYKTLVIVANNIKNMVKSQYGINSIEYNLVKVLAF